MLTPQSEALGMVEGVCCPPVNLNVQVGLCQSVKASKFLPEHRRLRANSVAITCMMSPILSRSMSPNRAGWERTYIAK